MMKIAPKEPNFCPSVSSEDFVNKVMLSIASSSMLDTAALCQGAVGIQTLCHVQEAFSFQTLLVSDIKVPRERRLLIALAVL